MIWEEYLKAVKDNDPWEISYRWAYFAQRAVYKMDSSIARTREYLTVSDDLIEATKLKDPGQVDWVAEVMEPRGDVGDNSFFVDQHRYDHDEAALEAHNMAITGFSSCLAILSAWGITAYRSPLWEDNKEMSTFPEIIEEIDSSGYLPVFKDIILNNRK